MMVRSMPAMTREFAQPEAGPPAHSTCEPCERAFGLKCGRKRARIGPRMKFSRRTLIGGLAASTAGGALVQDVGATVAPGAAGRRFPYVQMDVFSSRRLEGNQLV